MPDKITDAVKLLVQYAWAVWGVTAVILFVPPAWLAPLGIGPFVSVARPYIGLLFLAATVLLLGRAGKAGYEKYARDTASRREVARQHERLHKLTAAEQDVLRQFIANHTRTQNLYWADGVVVGLEQAQVIEKAMHYVREGLPCDYNMQEWVYLYLIEHPELVGLDVSDVSTASCG